MNEKRHTMELTTEEREIILAYRRADQITRRNIRVIAFDRDEPVPCRETGRVVAINTARSFSDLR